MIDCQGLPNEVPATDTPVRYGATIWVRVRPHHGFECMRPRGLTGARDEFHLAAIVQNLKTMAPRLIRSPPKPKPT